VSDCPARPSKSMYVRFHDVFRCCHPTKSFVFARRERWVRRVARSHSEAGGVGGEENLRYQEEEEGSKSKGGREEGGKTTPGLTLHYLMIQQLIVHDRNDPTASLPSFLARVILFCFRTLQNDIFYKMTFFSKK